MEIKFPKKNVRQFIVEKFKEKSIDRSSPKRRDFVS